MTDAGIIRGFRARLSVLAVGALTIWIFGRSQPTSTTNLQVKLHENDSTYWVAFGSGDFVYLGAYLRDFSQLEQYASFVQKEAQLVDPTIGIMPTLPQGAKRLYPIDYQIICALHKDCRKSLSDVAEELHISAKTVRRRLAKMIGEGLVELSIEWYPDVSNDILTMFHLRLGAMADKRKIINMLLKKYGPNILFFAPFGNLPNLMLSFIWTNTMKELKELRERLQSEEAIESIMSNVLYTGYMFDTWRDKLLLEKGAVNH
jgi:DNA-binding Lrp family transcriptional regulator